MTKLKWVAAGKTDVGKKRQNNEDNYVINEEIGLLAVADGMGGHKAGEVASRMAVDILSSNLSTLVRAGRRPTSAADGLSLAAAQMKFCAQLANQAIFEASKNYPQDHGMGTTLTSVLVHPDGLTLAHVGDSRIYLYRNDHLEQITKDHSLVMDQVRHGVLTKEQAAASDLKNVLSRAVGIDEKIDIDTEDHPAMEHDILILGTDGLDKMVTDEEIMAIVRSTKEPILMCGTLVEAALAAGGRDNVTIIVAKAQKAGFFNKFGPRGTSLSDISRKEAHA